MSSFAVTVKPVTIYPHPNADALELAGIDGYRAVVAKGAFQSGDLAVYIPEQAVLPAELIDELGLTGKLAGKTKDRVKAIRLRGELSQGIVCRPTAIPAADLRGLADTQTCVADRLEIIKYVPEIPAHLSGEVVAAPDLIPMFDVDDIKAHPTLFSAGEKVIMTEKTHGVNITIMWADGQVTVTSKGHGQKRLALVEDPKNLYWRAVHAHNIPETLASLANQLHVPVVVAYGEVYGSGVQDLAYGTNAGLTPGFVLFDLATRNVLGQVSFIDAIDLPDVIDGALPLPPVLYDGPYDYELVAAAAEGKESMSGQELHIREGGVLRPARERHSPLLGGRTIAKVINPDYLTRKGGTEYN